MAPKNRRKSQEIYRCRECGAEAAKWFGRCPECGAWNTAEEAVVTPGGSGSTSGPRFGAAAGSPAGSAVGRPVALADIPAEQQFRRNTGIPEFDRVLGGGLTVGSSVLIGGAPGVGKSTLGLQAVGNAEVSLPLYVSGEESPAHLRSRAARLGVDADRLRVLFSNNLEEILCAIETLKPDLILVDSIQTVLSEEAGVVPGTPGQVKYCGLELVEAARSLGSTLVLIAHVTKEGSIAGPKVLEHLVDTVLYFEGSDRELRFLRATKNRFGAVDEVGLFLMTEGGLKEVADPGRAFLVKRSGEVPPGVITAPIYEGSRVFLVEIEALTVPAKGGFSRVYSDRIDSSRVARIAAVIEKHLGLTLSDQDLYVNVAGGFRIRETGVELPIALALVSALTNRPIPASITATGELSLSGDIRPVPKMETRARASRDLGFPRPLGPPPAGESGSVTWKALATLRESVEASSEREAAGR